MELLGIPFNFLIIYFNFIDIWTKDRTPPTQKLNQKSFEK